MRAPRFALFASAAALMTAAGAQAQDQTQDQMGSANQAEAAAQADARPYTDEELLKYDAAIARVRTVSDTLNGAQPTPEQQAEMAAAVQDSGLEVVRFNAISRAAAEGPVINARIRALKAPPPAPGSVAASVTDDELARFVEATTKIRAITSTVQNGQATPEQSAQLTAAVQGSGLPTERFNAIATAVSQDPGLQARAQVVRARQQAAPQ